MTMPTYQSITLFTPPRMSEERKVYWNPGGYSQSARASGLGGLGDGFSDFFKQLHSGFMDVVDTVTGQRSQREAQQNAIALATLRAQQAEAEARSRSEGWGAAAPWLAIGGAVAIVAVVMSTRK